MTKFNRINILPPSVFNLIAAGEVVERPSSAVKELVENSIDSGARRIVIEIKNGGYDLISVTDNGCGIYEEDIEAAFYKHATSKLLNADDLNTIQTLGFRGEALSSIAAVSHVVLTTRQQQSEVAVRVQVEEGKIASKEYVTANVGTQIEVRDLYYNVPARRKFMKEGGRESSDITKFVSKLVLTNPNLEITYIADGKKVYQTKGNGLDECIFAVYGATCLQNCLPISYDGEFLRITGYIGTPDFTKPNTTYQTLSVNGRCIFDKNIQGAVTRAYQPYLMTRKFPFFVLDLSIMCDWVDVNVHPRKTEVRFQNVNLICGKFYKAVSEALSAYTRQKVDSILATPTLEEPQNAQHVSQLWDTIPDGTPAQYEDVMEIERQTRLSSQMPLEEFADELERTVTVENARRALDLGGKNSVKQPVATLELAPMPNVPQTAYVHDVTDELLARTRVLGALFRTYLILELDDKFILVDQHAAHERILFDKFMEGKSFDMQSVMFPYVFKVKSDEADFIERNIPNILKAGIEVEPFGQNTFRICAVSTLLADTKMEDFVQYLLSETEEFELDDRTLIVEKIAKKACKAAVKAGYMLSEMEIRYILKCIYENKILQCPHGRPITVVYTKTQIEKMFKRIV